MTHRVALIGYGLAGKAFHAPLINAVSGLELTTIVSSREDEIHSDHPRVQIRSRLEDVLADPEIELVVIASPDHVHGAQAIAALNAGKHVVIDKPFAPTLIEARAIAACAHDRGRLLSVFHNRRWDADFLTLCKQTAAGELGTIREIESRFDRFRPVAGTRWKDQRVGGVWQDLGPHLVDQMLVLLGAPLGVTADLAILRPGGQAIDHAQVILRYPACRVMLHISQSLVDHGLRFAVHGTRASFVKHGIDPQEEQSKAGMLPSDARWGIDPQPANLKRADGEIMQIVPERGDYAAYYRAIAAALSGTGPLPVTADDALNVMEVIAAGITSSSERREILI
ncbi:MAG: oxidoreductase [Alphaproteobacteria bacterium]|nr:oxidoreductase [Alphaproteobacteria bacterium]MDE2041653.1 oxidoreductase [Alphaproteobacteria bacterium]MDE2341509.1 oxidoreductase [Alphaproteobacteria bacterium]